MRRFATLALTVAAIFSGNAAGAVDTSPCPENPEGRCGKINVPLERSSAGGPTIPIGFELYPHTGPGPARGTIVTNPGGPGASTTLLRQSWLLLVEPLRDQFDLLLVDVRGTGSTAPIDCFALELGLGSLLEAAAACAAHLGDAADDYSSVDMVDDIDDVRAALGIDRIDFWGISWGTQLGQIYALRHPEHLRTLILDSVVPLVDGDPFVLESEQAHGLLSAIENVCGRSDTCQRLGGDPTARFEELVKRVQRGALRGTAFDPVTGETTTLDVDEPTLIRAVYGFSGLVEINGVAAALASRNDAAPLLRLASETLVPVGGGDPHAFSYGTLLAAFCTDANLPWDKGGSREAREEQLAAALASLPERSLGPFSATGWQRSSVGSIFEACLVWPAPKDAPPLVPAGREFPGTPTLVLAGDIDLRTPAEGARRVEAQFPNAHYVEFANAGHGIAGQSLCGDVIVHAFLENLTVEDASCAAEPLPFATSDFPATVSKVTARGRRQGRDRSTLHDRRVVVALIQTVGDAIAHPFTDRGLRGGVADVDSNPFRYTIEFRDSRFVRDLAVSGVVGFDFRTGRLAGTLDVRGGGTDPGRLQLVFDLVRDRFVVSGELGGRAIRLRIPRWT
jgi:pimeloyl-ACP methyl ester carboxylesterase